MSIYTMSLSVESSEHHDHSTRTGENVLIFIELISFYVRVLLF